MTLGKLLNLSKFLLFVKENQDNSYLCFVSFCNTSKENIIILEVSQVRYGKVKGLGQGHVSR